MKPPILSILLLGVIVIHSTHAQNATVVLGALYSSTAGDKWINSQNWLQGSPCPDGDWFGIKCDGELVKEIDLSNNRLVGTLPASLSQITSLYSVNFDTNPGISGAIPDWSALGNLTFLHLSNTSLSGGFPLWVTELLHLTFLSISQNDINDTFPDSYCSMHQLQLLDLGNQPISGIIPSCIGDMTSLRTLNIIAGSLTGSIPSSVGNLFNLEDFDLAYNQLSGSIPDVWTNLTALRIIDFNNNFLNGSLPASLGQLTSLAQIHLRSNAFSGTVPNLGALAMLEYLGLDNNNLTGTIPEWLHHLPSLEFLDLSCNNFLAPLPNWLQSDPQKFEPPLNVDLGCNYNITELPQWCLDEERCGPTACETRCQRVPPATIPPVSKTVVIMFIGFVCILLIGNTILLTIYVRRKIKYRNIRRSELVPLIQ